MVLRVPYPLSLSFHVHVHFSSRWTVVCVRRMVSAAVIRMMQQFHLASASPFPSPFDGIYMLSTSADMGSCSRRPSLHVPQHIGTHLLVGRERHCMKLLLFHGRGVRSTQSLPATRPPLLGACDWLWSFGTLRHEGNQAHMNLLVASRCGWVSTNCDLACVARIVSLAWSVKTDVLF